MLLTSPHKTVPLNVPGGTHTRTFTKVCEFLNNNNNKKKKKNQNEKRTRNLIFEINKIKPSIPSLARGSDDINSVIMLVMTNHNARVSFIRFLELFSEQKCH